MSILEELWYGNVTPNQRSVGQDDRTRKLGGYLLRHEEKLIPLLSEEAKAIYEKIRDNQEELRRLDEREAFCRGFRLGARIAYETMEGTDVPSIDD